MNIKINGKEKTLENNLSLSECIHQELNGKEEKGIAVAVNYKIIPRQHWNSVQVSENDQIEIVHAVQGG